jgi:hypothetical protein
MSLFVRQDRAPGRGSAGGAFPPSRRSKAAAYTLLELQVTLVILATGLLAMPALLAMQGRQMRQVDAWCRSDPIYYVVSPSNRWLRQFQAPAELRTEPGDTGWTPPVTGSREWVVHLNSLTSDLENGTIEADTSIDKKEEEE